MVKPNFLFIGPDKTGSSWMYEILRQHPECYVPRIKDIYFFDRHYEKGMKWYLSFFRQAPSGVKAIGELSHDYLFSDLATARIKKDLPGVKLLTTLRNPVERTFSQYLHWLSRGWTDEPFETILQKHPEFINNSLYFKHLSVYLERFDQSQIKILFFEDLKKNPEKFASAIFDFLAISFPHHISYNEQVQPSSVPRSFVLARLARKCAMIIRNMGYPTSVGLVKHHALTKLFYKPYGSDERPEMSIEMRTFLMERFRSDILQLSDLINVDLTHWLNKES
jgi:hypothetical protein